MNVLITGWPGFTESNLIGQLYVEAAKKLVCRIGASVGTRSAFCFSSGETGLAIAVNYFRRKMTAPPQ